MHVSMLFTAKKTKSIRRRACQLLCLGVLLTAFLVMSKSLYSEMSRTNIKIEGLQSIQISSTQYSYFSYPVDKPYSTIFQDKKLYYKTTSRITDITPDDHYTFAFLYEDERQIPLHYSPTLNVVFDQKYHMLEPSPDLKEGLLELVALYRQRIAKTYGTLLVWEEVDKVFPMYAIARITDIYSGASFHVQRREGSSHVDAQPLNAEDTATMKKIFNGRWSWERKGIIVEVRGYRIAASMNGMPHGGGKIDDNNFPGHFCIHFLGSTIHSGGMDIQHHREILKAAGMLPLADV